MTRRLFDTALLTVNKQVYANARVAFFEENTFSITHAGNAIYHPDIRHLDINGQFASAICEDVTLDPSKVALFLALPKLQTLILHTNKLHDHLMTVRVFIGVDPHWTSLTCTGFGVFELEPSAEWIAGVRSATNSPPPRIYLRDSSLAWIVKSLLKAKKLALKHNGPYLQSAMLNSTPIYSKTYGLAWWLRSYEDYRKLSADPAGHSLTGPEVEGVEDFVRTRLLTTRGLQFTNSQLPNDTWLADVVTGKGYSAELLEWASELLGRELWPMGQDTD